MGNASLDGVDGGALLDGNFPFVLFSLFSLPSLPSLALPLAKKKRSRHCNFSLLLLNLFAKQRG